MHEEDKFFQAVGHLFFVMLRLAIGVPVGLVVFNFIETKGMALCAYIFYTILAEQFFLWKIGFGKQLRKTR